MTSPDAFRAVERVFNEVCGLPESEWESRIYELAPSDPVVRSEVRELLEADQRAEKGSGPSPTVIQSAVSSALTVELRDPDEIGGYQILGRLGQGGMGIVYEAEQRNPKRTVALKVLASGAMSDELVRRFEYETEALARLRHPGIAQIYESGLAQGERSPIPYFVMELIQGHSLDEWSRNASTGQRLDMAAQIADALQHAHSKGVVHRDLKPSNILVTREGTPKILDFGVARIANAEFGHQTALTKPGQLVGTLAYMSPELLSGDPNAIDTRSDIYALGVVLYEMLAGSRPIDVDGKAIVDVAREINEGAVQRLSERSVACRGDIEIIVNAAMAPARERRYQTAASFADDIRRFRAGQTIAARPASAVYQLSRLARRHRAATASLAVSLIVASAAAIAVLVSFNEAVVQRQEAERRAAIAEAVTAFFNTDVLAAADPNALGHEATVREAVDRAAERIDGRFGDEPETGAAIRNSIANVYHVMGEYERAGQLAEVSLQMFGDTLGPSHELTQYAQQDVGAIARDRGDFDQAREALKRSLEMREASIGEHDPATLENVIMLAELERDGFGNLEEAQMWLDVYASRAGSHRSPDDSVAVYAEMTRGGIALAMQDYQTAARSYRFVAEARETIYGNDHSATLTAWANVAVALEALGRFADAEPIYLRVLEVEERMGGKDNPDRLPTAHNLAFLYQSMGRFSEAEELFVDTLERCERVYGSVHPGTLTCVQSLASLYRDTDRLELAIETLASAHAAAKREIGEDAPPVLEIALKLGVMYVEVDRPEEGERLFSKAVPALRELLPPNHPVLTTSAKQWGVCLLRLGQLDAARAVFNEAAASAALQDSDEADHELAEISRHLQDIEVRLESEDD